MVATDYITKVIPPRPRSDYVARRRLLNLLHSAVSRKAALIQAPAGFGKTSLLAQFSKDVEIPVCWLTLDRSDRDPMKLIQDISASISRTYPSFPTDAGIQDRMSYPMAQPWDEALATLLNGAHRHIPEIFILVLDDLHIVQDEPEIVRLLDALLTHSPENIRLLLGTRTKPDLPSLPRLRAQREISRITETQLRFTAKEVKEFFRAAYNRRLSDDQASSLVDRTNGWISAIILLGENLEDDQVPDMSREAQEDLFEFLANEVFSHQPEGLKRFLLETSILDQLEPDVCDELTGRPESRSWLSHLDQHNLFVSLAGDGRPVYRLHALFRNFLLDTAARSDTVSVEGLHCRAGEVFEARGRIPEAIQHYLKSHSYERAAALLEETCELLFQQGNWLTLSDWIEALPEHLLKEHPGLLVCRAWISVDTGDPDGALELSSRAITEFQSANNPAGIVRALFAKSVALRRKGLLSEAVTICQDALEHISRGTGEAGDGLQAEALKHLGVILYESGDLQRALDALTQCLRISEVAGDTHTVAAMHNLIGQIHGLRMHFSDAISHFEFARHAYGKLNNQQLAAAVLNNIAVLYHFRGDLDMAEETLDDAIRLARNSSNSRAYAFALASLADVRRDAGDLGGALQAYRESQDTANAAQQTALVPYLVDGIATVHRLSGELDRAEALARRSLAGDRTLSKIEEGLYKRSLGAILSEKGRFEESAALLNEARTLLGNADVPQEAAKVEFFLGYLCFRAGKPDESVKHLNALCILLEKIQHNSFLIAEARDKLDFVEYAVSQSVGERWFYPLLHAARKSPRKLGGRGIDGVPHEYPEVECYSLGTCEVRLDGKPVPKKAWETKTAVQMLFFFIRQSRPLRKDEIIEAIWPSCSPAKGNSSFQSTIYRIRGALYREAIVESNGRYALNQKGRWWLDAREFERLVRTSGINELADETQCSLLEEAVGLYRGRFLLDFDAGWVDGEQRTLHEAYVTALSRLGRHYRDSSRYEDVVHTCELLLKEEPYDEEAIHRLMAAHDSLGNLDAAIRSYREYAARLHDELDDDPSRETESLYQTILTKH